MNRYRPTRAEIDLGAIRDNVRELASLVSDDVQKLAVVKANAYGHGDVTVARACLEAGATWLGVALVEEGIRLREAGIDVPILVLVEAPPEAARAIVAHDLTPSVFTLAGAEALSGASDSSRPRGVHVCVDTGMHREGVPLDDAHELIELVAKMPGLRIEGLWSHFAVADQQDDPFTLLQLERFGDLCDALARRGIEVPVRHLSNSVAIMAHPEAHFEMVRLGISTYGLYPSAWLRERVGLRPAMRLVSAVGMVRRVPAGEGISYGLTYAPTVDSTIATIPIGYGDGFTRLLSNKAEVLIGGVRRPIAGRVTMDTIMVDCGSDEISPGAEVVLIGRQGGEEITADEIADKLGTINYEVVTSVGARVPRVYP